MKNRIQFQLPVYPIFVQAKVQKVMKEKSTMLNQIQNLLFLRHPKMQKQKS